MEVQVAGSIVSENIDVSMIMGAGIACVKQPIMESNTNNSVRVSMVRLQSYADARVAQGENYSSDVFRAGSS